MHAPRLQIHDQFQLELKLDTPLDPTARRSRRTFEAWMFFPNSLGIDEPAFRREDFYEDLVAHVRFQTPKMSLARLFDDADSPGGWLARHERALTSGSASARELGHALREIRLLAAVFRSNLRDETGYLLAHLRNGQRGVVAEHLEATTRFVGEARAALARFRDLRRRFLDARTPDGLREALIAIDDFVSLQAVEAWFRLVEVLEDRPEAGAVRDGLLDAVRSETTHRVGVGHTGPLEVEDPLRNELFVTRLNALKKYVLAVLHLRLVTSRRAERVQDLLFGIAAAVAMTLAVILQLAALWTVGTPSGWLDVGTMASFVALMVGGYILKDRVKDRLRLWFAAGMPQWLYDRRQNLCVEATGVHIGAVEDTAQLVRTRELPPDVARVREHGEEPLFAGMRAEEDVVHFRRVVLVDGRRAKAQAPEMSALNEILRFNVRRWIRRMDEPIRWLYRLQPDGRIERVPGGKTYRVTMVLAQREHPKARPTYEKFTVVLTREGIVRVEPGGSF
ncbi:MAG: hypothetical protein ACOZNI_03125 [Myxococcota bacterium]